LKRWIFLVLRMAFILDSSLSIRLTVLRHHQGARSQRRRTSVADGKPFLLGRRNVAETVSALAKRGVGPALRLLVDSGPPLEVNSQGKVANLNADKVDGKDADAFLAADGKARDSTHADRSDWAADAQKLGGTFPYELRTGVAELRVTETVLLPPFPETITFGGLSIRVPFPGYLRLSGNVTLFQDQSNIIAPNPDVELDAGMIQGHLGRVFQGGWVPSVESREDITGRRYANLALDGVLFVSEGVETAQKGPRGAGGRTGPRLVRGVDRAIRLPQPDRRRGVEHVVVVFLSFASGDIPY
jgi:hypothetical protein